MTVKFVPTFDTRKFFQELQRTPTGNALITEAKIEEVTTHCELLESLLKRAAPLLERSERIINNQMPGVPHLIEGPLEQLRIDIEEALTKIEIGEPSI